MLIIRCKRILYNHHYYSYYNNIRKYIHNNNNNNNNNIKCWKCNTSLPSSLSLLSSLYCINKECNVIQEISRNNCNYFDLFNIKQSFLLDEKQLGN